MPKSFQPNKGFYLVRRKDADEQTKGGLIIPETAKEKPQQGEIVATHPENAYKVGDNPLFGKYAGVDLKLDGMDGETFLLLPEDEIFGLLVETKRRK
jgi:chaperonin GroES